MTNKFCNKCSIEKDISEFNKNKKTKDGLQTACKTCMKIKLHEWYCKNKEKHAEHNRQWRENNAEYHQQYRQEYHESTKDSHSQYMKQWYLDNKEHAKANSHKWQNNNRTKIRENTRIYGYNRRRRDIGYKLTKTLRTRLYSALKNNQKVGSAVRDLGCSIPELKLYLESKFQPGMSWDNYGKWHIDHIVPLSSFDLSDPEQQKVACRYTNLQPLWAEDNLKKSNKILEPNHE